MCVFAFINKSEDRQLIHSKCCMDGKKIFLVDKNLVVSKEFTHYLNSDEQIKKTLSTPKALIDKRNTSYC
jgi:hypothetical protein